MSMNNAAAFGTSLTTTHAIGAQPPTLTLAGQADFNRRAAMLVHNEDAQGLAELFGAAAETGIIALDLHGTDLRPCGLECLAQALRGSGITRLNLAQCSLGASHAQGLETLMGPGNALQHLQLSGNPYLANCASVIANALKSNSQLLHLNLNDCDLPSESCDELLAACSESRASDQSLPARNSTLRSLCLAGNGRHGTGVWPYREGRGRGVTMPGLRWLDLSRSGLIGVTPGREPIIPDFLQNLPHGLYLQLDGIVLPYGCTQTLVKALARGGVTILSMRSCRLESTLRPQSEGDCLAHVLAIPSLQILQLAGSANVIHGNMLDDPDAIAHVDPAAVFEWIAAHPNLKIVQLDAAGDAAPLIEQALGFNPAVRLGATGGIAALLMTAAIAGVLDSAGLVADIAPRIAFNLDYATALNLRAVARAFAAAGMHLPVDPSFDWEMLWTGEVDLAEDSPMEIDTHGPIIEEMPNAGDIAIHTAVGGLADQVGAEQAPQVEDSQAVNQDGANSVLMNAVSQANTTSLFQALQAGARDTDGSVLAAARAKAAAEPASLAWIRIVNLLERPDHYLALGRPF
jgi:hypothetical protein